MAMATRSEPRAVSLLANAFGLVVWNGNVVNLGKLVDVLLCSFLQRGRCAEHQGAEGRLPSASGWRLVQASLDKLADFAHVRTPL